MPQKNESRVTMKVNPTPEADAPNFTSVLTDFECDKSAVDAVDKGLGEAIFDGDLRLEVPCRRCGRWLFSGPSKRRHYGPTFAIKAAGKEMG